MKDIEIWLEHFEKYWKEKDIDNILSLFTDDVEYFETPEQKLNGRDAIRNEWMTIKQQSNISLHFEIRPVAFY